MPIKHLRTIDRGDGQDPGAAQPSDWNAAHQVTGLLGKFDAIAPSPGTFPNIDNGGNGILSTISNPARELLAAQTKDGMRAAIDAVSFDSPAFINTPTAPTAPLGNNTTRIATMAALKAMRDDLVNAAPGALDTLQELATALGSDPNFATTMAAALGNRVRFDVQQTLTPTQRAQILRNMPERGTYSPLECGAIGDGVADDTAAVLLAISKQQAAIIAAYEIAGGVGDVYSGTVPALDFSNARFKISDALPVPGYFRAVGQNAAIIQTNPAKSIFVGAGAYDWDVKGLSFVGGLHHADISNSNIDGSCFFFDNCEHHLSSASAIKTAGAGGTNPDTGLPWAHLSALLLITRTYMSRCRQLLENACDLAVIDQAWFNVTKDNFAANSAAIINKGETAGASSAPPQLVLGKIVGVSAVGTGASRVAFARWIDNYGSVLVTAGTRLGGEDAGMTPIYNFAKPASSMPQATKIIIEASSTFCGPSSDPLSAVVTLMGEMPNLISIKNNHGPIDVPYVVNGGGILDPTTYFPAWAAAAGKKDFEGFTVDLPTASLGTNLDGVSSAGRVPSWMRRFVKRDRLTIVKRSTAQTITNGFTSNFVSFDTVEFDNLGAWSSGLPTQLVAQPGAMLVHLSFTADISGHDAGTIVTVAILRDFSGEAVARQSFVSGTNADDDGVIVNALVTAEPGAVFRAVIRTNGSANLMMRSGARMSIRPLNHVG